MNIQLGGNKIGEEGASYIAAALQENTALRRLVLGDNGIGTAGAEQLASVIPTNETLRELLLSDNDLKEAGCRLLVEALRENVTLCELNLELNGLEDWKLQQELNELIERNQENRANFGMTSGYRTDDSWQSQEYTEEED